MIGREFKTKTGEVWTVIGSDRDKWVLQPVDTFAAPAAFTVDQLRAEFSNVRSPAAPPEREDEISGWRRLAAFANRAAQRQAHGTYGLLTPEEALRPDVEAAVRERAEVIAADPEGLLADALIGLLPLSAEVEAALRELVPAFEDDDDEPATRPHIGVTQAQARRLGHRA